MLATVEARKLRRAVGKVGLAALQKGLPRSLRRRREFYLSHRYKRWPRKRAPGAADHRYEPRRGALFAKWADELPTNAERIDHLLEDVDPAVKRQVANAYAGYSDRTSAVRLGGDFVFWRPTITACESHSAHAPVYNYRYDFAPPMLNRMGLGATHAWEMFAVFGYGDSPAGRAITATGGRRAMRAVTDEVQRHWLSFARTVSLGRRGRTTQRRNGRRSCSTRTAELSMISTVNAGSAGLPTVKPTSDTRRHHVDGSGSRNRDRRSQSVARNPLRGSTDR